MHLWFLKKDIRIIGLYVFYGNKFGLDETRYENGGWRYRIKLDRTDLSEEHKVVVAIISENSLAVVTTMKQAYRN